MLQVAAVKMLQLFYHSITAMCRNCYFEKVASYKQSAINNSHLEGAHYLQLTAGGL